MTGKNGAMTAFVVVAVFLITAVGAVSSDSSEGAKEFTSYYDQLSANEKAVYDKMKDADFSTYVLEVTLPVTLYASASDPADAEAYLKGMAKSITDNAVRALMISSPLVYWAWAGLGVTMEDPVITTTGSVKSLSKVTVKVTTTYIVVEEGGTKAQAIEKMQNDLQAAVDSYEVKGNTAKEKVLEINNYIVNKVTYDPKVGISGEESLYCHDAYGALVSKDNLAVCDGYAKAFLLLCEKAGIPCVVVFGTAVDTVGNHAWNYVKMDDGKWYAIDVTWNDNGKKDNPYFLMGSKNFFKIHNQGVFLIDGMKPYPFDSPILNINNYGESDEEKSWWDSFLSMQLYGWLAAGIIVAILIGVIIFHQVKTKKKK